MFEVRIPSLGESITEATIAHWAKADGDTVGPDDVLLELESDKATTELPAERAGVLHILKLEGETVAPGDVVARIEESNAGAAAKAPEAATQKAPAAPPPATAVATGPAADGATAAAPAPAPARPGRQPGPLSPAVRNLIAEHDLDPTTIPASGKGGRLTKGDVITHLERRETPAAAAVA